MIDKWLEALDAAIVSVLVSLGVNIVRKSDVSTLKRITSGVLLGVVAFVVSSIARLSESISYYATVVAAGFSVDIVNVLQAFISKTIPEFLETKLKKPK